MTIFEVTPGPDAPRLWAWGNPAILDMPRAAVLSSRISRSIAPTDTWVAAVKHLTRQAVTEGRALISSLNTRPYELACRLAVEAGAPLIVVCDGPLPDLDYPETCAVFLEDYNGLMDFSRTVLVSPYSPDSKIRPKDNRVGRDETVVALADRVFCAEIRTGGHMERLSLQAIRQGKRVQVGLPKNGNTAAKGIKTLLAAGAEIVELPEAVNRPQTKPISSTSISFNPTPLRGYLIHFTRACSGPWPGQTLADYYDGLIHNRPGAAHTAMDTLKRILTESRIRGGSRLTRGGSKAVSFVDGGIPDWSALFRWRKGLARWTMEPYGVAVPREDLIALGAKPVIYGGEDVWETLPEGKRHLFQIHRPPQTDWRVEQEWRLAGDFLLGTASRNKITVLVPTRAEATAIESEFHFRTLSLIGGQLASAQKSGILTRSLKVKILAAAIC